jgi:hypothetical protein
MKFKPCPFCGGIEIHFQKTIIENTNSELDDTVFHYVRCFDCDCRTGDCCDYDASECMGYTGEDPGKQYAAASWNLRK